MIVLGRSGARRRGRHQLSGGSITIPRADKRGFLKDVAARPGRRSDDTHQGEPDVVRLARVAMCGLQFVVLFVACASPIHAQSTDSAKRAAECSGCAEWNAPQKPFRIHGNTYYVGPHGLSAVLVTSPAGHVLIDGGLEESAPLIMANIRSLTDRNFNRGAWRVARSRWPGRAGAAAGRGRAGPIGPGGST